MEPETQAETAAVPSVPHNLSGVFLRRFGLIGDIHGDRAYLQTALDRLADVRAEGGLDAILCTGDIPGDQEGSDTRGCCELLQAHGVITVRGNHDRWAIENAHERVLIGVADEWPLPDDIIDYFRALPQILLFPSAMGTVMLCHGTGDDDEMGVYPGDFGAALEANHKLHSIYSEGQVCVMVTGHTHQRMVKRLDHLTILNGASVFRDRVTSFPARVSPGTALRLKNPCYSVVDLEQQRVRFYNIHHETLEATPAEEWQL